MKPSFLVGIFRELVNIFAYATNSHKNLTIKVIFSENKLQKHLLSRDIVFTFSRKVSG